MLSQFWPTSPPAKYTFPRRNVVASGTPLGSVAIEASSTSGAKMQARLAAEHGKLVFLIRSLADTQPWRRRCLRRTGRSSSPPPATSPTASARPRTSKPPDSSVSSSPWLACDGRPSGPGRLPQLPGRTTSPPRRCGGAASNLSSCWGLSVGLPLLSGRVCRSSTGRWTCTELAPRCNCLRDVVGFSGMDEPAIRTPAITGSSARSRRVSTNRSATSSTTVGSPATVQAGSRRTRSARSARSPWGSRCVGSSHASDPSPGSSLACLATGLAIRVDPAVTDQPGPDAEALPVGHARRRPQLPRLLAASPPPAVCLTAEP